jgi:hypothetical protein
MVAKEENIRYDGCERKKTITLMDANEKTLILMDEKERKH